MTHIEQPHWADEALCAQVDPDLWFPEHGAFPLDPRKVCATCTASAACLDDAMAMELGLHRSMRYGIRAGLSPTKRKQLEPQWSYWCRTCEIHRTNHPTKPCPVCKDAS